MGAQDLDGEHVYMAQSLPTPTDTPYRTPLGPLSRPTSRYGSSSPGPSSSPAPLPPDQGWTSPPDVANDEKISILDPRRFTPTLHASLVSEILSLRRDLDARTGFIEQLERSLESTRTDCDDANRNLLNTSKEVRSLRRQLQLLEGGSSSALGELARERDEAVEGLADVKRRLESSQKKVRAEEENATRIQRLWDRDRQSWEEQRRTMERKVHVVEGRLKAILEEVAAQQAATQARTFEHPADPESDGDEASGETGIPSTNPKSNRPMSIMSNDSVRLSTMMGLNGHLGSVHMGLSLADELSMEDEDGDQHDDEETRNRNSISDERASSDPVGESSVAGEVEGKRVSGTTRELAELVADIDMQQKADAPDGQKGDDAPLKRTADYVDTGIQFTPPPSPKLRAVSPDSPQSSKTGERASSPTDHEANQGRKRVWANRSSILGPAELPLFGIPTPTMVSSSCQTLEESPTAPPASKLSSPTPPAPPTAGITSTATQTEPPAIPKPEREPPPPPRPSTPPPSPMAIPSIAIHPPTSAPSSPGPPVLPPRTKHAACQVSANRLVKQRSIAVQTEEIRIDKRAIKLPPHLLPSSISSNPPSPELTSKTRAFKPISPPRRSSRRVLRVRNSIELPSSPPRLIQRAVYSPENGARHDADHPDGVKLPSRSSSLLGGFDLPSSDEGDDFGDADLSDGDYRTALSAPGPRSDSRKFGAPGTSRPVAPVANDKTSRVGRDPGWRPSDSGGPSRRGASSPTDPNGKPLAKQPRSNGVSTATFTKASLGRRSSSRFGGVNARWHRTGSPVIRQVANCSEHKPDAAPPFPVPTRYSSRRLPISVSEGARSPSRLSESTSAGSRRKELGRLPINENLRKVRSAATIARGGPPARLRSRSPPPSPFSPLLSPESPQLPPLPKDRVTPPFSNEHHYRSIHSQQPSTNTSYTRDVSLESSGPQKDIVDAIAQTMVGEWMWKYVRRRKSFGVTENSQSAADFGRTGEDVPTNLTGNNGIRHKRWVWLAPYERAVMWSSKQPTSGPALLGKSGRKLVIQSVLDVKDDTPGPKLSGGQTLFNRSILILTPARALKFTATSKDRHYLWLTALSFLSRPSIGEHELVALPPIPPAELEAPHSAGLRRNPIRDSIRVAKGKARSRSTKPGPPPPPPPPLVSGAPFVSGLHSEPAIPGADDKGASRGPIVTAAEPPNIPRFSTHGRHRSNTGGRPPLGALRSFTQPVMPSSNPSLVTNASSSLVYGPATSSLGGTSVLSGSGPSIYGPRASETSSRSAMTTTVNFFEAVGTVRMEAFVRGGSPAHFDGRAAYGGSPPASLASPERRWGGSHMPIKPGYLGRRSDDTDEFFRADDPFRGF